MKVLNLQFSPVSCNFFSLTFPLSCTITQLNLPAIIVYTENCTAIVGQMPRKKNSPNMVINMENLLNTVNIGRLSSWKQT
jgi:hypothetical protein